MNFITREELKEKLDRGDHFKLIMVLEDWHFRAMHIPGSIHIPARDIARDGLGLDDEIVVYCSHEACPGSMVAYSRLKANGYENVRRYAGGIHDWEKAGYPLEGEGVKPREQRRVKNPA